MNRLNTDIRDLTWDEYANAVDDELLLETGKLATEDELADVSTAFDAGMTPLARAQPPCGDGVRAGTPVTDLAA